MKKFIILYTVPIDATKQMANLPKEQQAEGMELWMNGRKKRESI